jgi:site-specific DNA-methyltransferase (adenine-specific)
MALQPFYEDPSTTIYCGDALAVLPELEEQVDVVIADPPYSSGGRTSGERTRSTTTKYVSSDSKRELPDFLGDSRDQRGHEYWCALWLSAALQRTRPGGVCFVWSDWRQLVATADALQAGGWTYRGVVIWKKLGGRPVKGRFKLDVEFAIWGSNGDVPVHRLAYPSSVVAAAAPYEREHIAQKPVEVYEHLLEIAGDRSTILDPFLGSGTTIAAARSGSHRTIGIELDPHFAEVSAARARN